MYIEENKNNNIIKFVNSKNQLINSITLSRRIKFLTNVIFKLNKISLKNKNFEILALCQYFQKILTTIQNKRYSHIQPKGLVLHIPASNINLMPFYSWAASFIVGNMNLVRLSKRINLDPINLIIDTFYKVDPEIMNSQIFVNADNFSHLIDDIKDQIDVRIIWGNDITIENIKKDYPLPRSLDIAFPSRYSASIISNKGFTLKSARDKIQFCRIFSQDTLELSFSACSSPHLLFWLLDSPNNPSLHLEFLNTLEQLSTKNIIDIGSITTDNYLRYQESILSHQFNSPTGKLFYVKGRPFEEISTISFSHKTLNEHQLDSKSLIILVESMQQFYDILPTDIQTLTYSEEINRSIIEDIKQKNSYGYPDRVVAIGKALEFDITWDGYNLIEILSKSNSLYEF